MKPYPTVRYSAKWPQGYTFQSDEEIPGESQGWYMHPNDIPGAVQTYSDGRVIDPMIEKLEADRAAKKEAEKKADKAK